MKAIIVREGIAPAVCTHVTTLRGKKLRAELLEIAKRHFNQPDAIVVSDPAAPIVFNAGNEGKYVMYMNDVGTSVDVSVVVKQIVAGWVMNGTTYAPQPCGTVYWIGGPALEAIAQECTSLRAQITEGENKLRAMSDIAKSLATQSTSDSSESEQIRDIRIKYDALALMTTRDQERMTLLRTQLLERDRRVAELESEVDQLRAELAQRPPRIPCAKTVRPCDSRYDAVIDQISGFDRAKLKKTHSNRW